MRASETDDMTLSIRNRYFILTILTVMAVYLPSSFIGVMGMDDYDLLERLESTSANADYWGLFFSGKSMVYYRPLLEVINLIDYRIWESSLIGYHLTNYLVHILNAVLVYSIFVRLFEHDKTSHVPAAIATLVFALNPLTCESVAWISGRSDIFGTFFSLLAVRSFLLNTVWRYILTPFFIVLGITCKENAFGIIPVILCLHLVLHFKGLTPDEQGLINRHTFLVGIKQLLPWCFVLSMPVLLYVLVRTSGGSSFEVDAQRITRAAGTATSYFGFDFSGYTRVFPAIAFYLKKIILPYPLNFSISSIHYSAYTALFIGLMCVNVFLCLKRHYVFSVATILLIASFLPALPIAIGGVAWAPFAERYLYLALCVWGGIVAYLFHCFSAEKDQLKPVVAKILLGILVVTSAIGTIARQMDWQSNEKILADTVKKASADNFRAMLNYALSHDRKDRILYLRKAEAASVDSQDNQWKAKLYMAIAGYYAWYDQEPIRMTGFGPEPPAEESDYTVPFLSEQEIVSEVFTYIDKGLEQSQRFDILNLAVAAITKLEAKDKKLQKEVIERTKIYYSKLHKLRPQGFYLYRIGGLEERLNHRDAAAAAYQSLIDGFPDSQYAVFAEKRLKKMNDYIQ